MFLLIMGRLRDLDWTCMDFTSFIPTGSNVEICSESIKIGKISIFHLTFTDFMAITKWFYWFPDSIPWLRYKLFLQFVILGTILHIPSRLGKI